MTDPGTADRTYIGPMTPELVEQIIAKASRDEAKHARFWQDRLLRAGGPQPVAP